MSFAKIPAPSHTIIPSHTHARCGGRAFFLGKRRRKRRPPGLWHGLRLGVLGCVRASFFNPLPSHKYILGQFQTVASFRSTWKWIIINPWTQRSHWASRQKDMTSMFCGCLFPTCQVRVVKFYHSCSGSSSSSFSSTSSSSSSFSSTSASTSTSTSALPTLRQSLRQLPLVDLNCRLPIWVGTAGPQPQGSERSGHRWTSTRDLPSSVRRHRWTSAARWNARIYARKTARIYAR